MNKILILLVTVLLFSALPLTAAPPPTISKEELKPLLGSPDLILLDVRTARDWNISEVKIPGAIRAPVEDMEEWITRCPKERTLVLYCACPQEATSTFLAQQLQEKGYSKVYPLKGGWREWFRARYPVEEK